MGSLHLYSPRAYWSTSYWKTSYIIDFYLFFLDGSSSISKQTYHLDSCNSSARNSSRLRDCSNNNFIYITVGCEKLDPLFFLNNLLNIQRRTLKPPAMCFYWAVRPFCTFEYLDLLRETWIIGNTHRIHIYLKKILPYFSCYYLKLKMGFPKKPPLKICSLLTIWVPMELKLKIFLEKLTQVISQSSMKQRLSGIHISRII